MLQNPSSRPSASPAGRTLGQHATSFELRCAARGRQFTITVEAADTAKALSVAEKTIGPLTLLAPIVEVGASPALAATAR